ncbi:MAG: branched-chain amino acid transport system substrate-binding protein [Actinomycetota bacterium]|jgi:ABC-type branched-subunit amino acid transport system substrate-binding protein|nr:branched-chain amino acid transport system substrate-binding protein [Actinomycetota bacterium]
MRRLLVALLVLAAPACSSGGGASTTKGEALVVVSAPLTAQPWVGRFAERGAKLAAHQLNRNGGAAGRKVVVSVLDNRGSPQQAVANARTAVAKGAVALITDGVGARAVAEVTDPVSLPVFIVFEGGSSLVDAKTRPTLFRMAPANKPMATRLSDYLSEKTRVAALIADDSTYGREGAAQTRLAFKRNEIRIASDATVPEGASDVAAQVLAARRSGAKVLVVWARATGVAAVVRAARASGWEVPVYSGPTGEDPLVRQRLADHPEWVDGLTFVSFRITSETGPAPFAAYRKAYEKAYGVDGVGVSAGGKPVVMPPDWSTYSFDAVKLVAAALKNSSGKGGAALMEALQRTVVTGANGDERGFGAEDREGVSPDDMYFGRFKDMRFVPVTDDILSTGLPTVAQ